MRKGRKLGRPSHGTVVAYLALFVALGSGAYAAKQLPKKSVGTKQLRKNAVTKQKVRKNAINGRKVKNNSLTGADIKLSKLGTVPSAQSATTAGAATTATSANVANLANSLAPSEGWHEVGSPGEPGFQTSWFGSGNPKDHTAAFYKDHEGIVHLRGVVAGGAAGTVIFQLPPGYRPATDKLHAQPILCTGGTCQNALGTGGVYGHNSESPELSGAIIGTGTLDILDGLSFRAES